MTSVVITNVTLLNTGDAAILRGEIALAQSVFGPDTHITVLDDHAEASRKVYPALDVRDPLFRHTQRGWLLPTGSGRLSKRLRNLFVHVRRSRVRVALLLRRNGAAGPADLMLRAPERAVLEVYRSADLVMGHGGTVLVEHYSLANRRFEYRCIAETARAFGFFPQSIEPLTNPRNVRAFRRIFRQAVCIMVRDQRSHDAVSALGVPSGRLHVVGDAAFAPLRPPPGEVRPQPGRGRPLRVALSVREWGHFSRNDPTTAMERYLAAVAALCEHLLDAHGAHMTFISTCQGLPAYWADDARVADRVVATLPKRVREHVVVDRRYHTPSELQRILGEFDLVVATRMHVAILAMMAGTPVVPIAYERKTEELFRIVSMPELVHDIEQMDTDRLRQTADHVLANLPGYRERTTQASQREADRARLAVPLLRQLRHGRPQGFRPCA